MKILHIITNLSSRYGGPSKACRGMCSALAASGNDVTIYTTNLEFPDGYLDVPVNKEVSENGYKVFYFTTQLSSYFLSWHMAKSLKKNIQKFDIIHIHGLYRFPQAISSYFARKYQIAHIIRPHGSLDPFLFNQRRHRYSKRLYEYLIENRNLNSATSIHYTSSEERELVKPLGLGKHSFVVPNGLNLDKYVDLPEYGIFKEKYSIEDKKVILHFGRIHFKKGMDILINAFNKVLHLHNNSILVIAGPDNDGYQTKVENWIREYDIESKVIFTGMLNHQESLTVLRDADIFVLPSYTENFGIAVIEAMVCKLPVVISNKVNIWKEIQHVGAGIVTNCNDIEVADAIAELLDNETLIEQMGIAGKKFVEEKYGWESIAKALELKYNDCIRSQSKVL